MIDVKIISYLLVFLFMSLYLFAEGLTEGYTWAKDERRKENKLISTTKCRLDYHFWRLMENVGILGLFSIGVLFKFPLLKLTIFALGTWMFGIYMIHERALDYVQYGKLFSKGDTYKLLGKTYQGGLVKEIITALIGVVFIITSLFL